MIARSPRTAYALLSPALLVLGLFVIWPLIRSVVWSLQGVGLLNPAAAAWNRGANYSYLLTDPRFRQAFLNTAWFALMVVPLQCLCAFFMALWVNRPERYWRWLRTAFFVPVVVSMPVLAILWTLLYQPVEGEQMGLVNAVLTAIGLPTRDWLHNPHWALPALAFMSIWQGVGFQMMIFLAGLQQLDRAQLEAARIDGANAPQRLWYVIVPGMRPHFIFVLTATTILAFRLFVQPYLMTRGGPQDRTLSVIQYIYETTFLNRDLGLASAGAILFLILVALITWAQYRAQPRGAA